MDTVRTVRRYIRVTAGTCVDTPGSPAHAAAYTCICDEGWSSGDSGPACTRDIDECSLPSPPCSKVGLVISL